MPVTYTLIASNTLSSSAASVTFSSIPNTYTDLVIKWSVRNTVADYARSLNIRFNGTTANYSATNLIGLNGSATATSDRSSNSTEIQGYITADTATANTFSNGEIYIPGYTLSQNKPISGFTVAENNNANNAVVQAIAGLWRNTAIISEILLVPQTSNLSSGSSFFLYGIKNS